MGRRNKIYACTLLGELVVTLARNGFRGAAQIVAQSSPSFSECLKIHLPRDPNYYKRLTIEIIEEISRSKRGEMVMRSDLDFYVRNIEFRWVKENIIETLNNPSSRPEILEYLKKIVNTNWLSEWLVPFIEKHVERENEWLQTLKDFKRDVKLTRFFLDKTE